MADVYSNCGCANGGDTPAVRVVSGNDLTVEALVSVYDRDSGVYKPLDLSGATDVALRLVGTYRKAIGKDITVTGSKVTAFFPGGSVGVGTYGVEITFVDSLGKGRIFERNLIGIVSASGDATVDNIIEGETGEGLNVTVNVLTRTVRIGTSGGSCVPDSALSETSENCVQNKVVTGAIRELQDYCFPTSLEASISPSSAEWTGNSVEVSVSFRVLRNSKPVVADTVRIQFNGETKTLENVAEGSEKFTLSTQGYKSGSVTAKKGSTTIKNSPRSISANLYLPVYYGFSKATTGNELTITSLTKGGSSLNGTKTLTNDDATKYLWLCVPNTMSINKVTSGGFDVPFLAPVEASTPLGTYKCYRTKDLPGAGSMTIVIS